MKRSRAVNLALLSSLASLLLSCREKSTRYCVDDYQSVVEDTKCDENGRHTGHYRWYYGGAHGFVPNGTRLTGGSTAPPADGFSTSHAGTARGVIGGAGEAASGHEAGGAHSGGGGE